MPATDDLANLQASHAELKAQLDQTQKQLAALLAQPSRPASPDKFPKNLILTVSEHKKLSRDDREEFATLNGTVTNDPAPADSAPAAKA